MLKDNPRSKSSKKTRSQNSPLTGLWWVSHIRHIFQVSPFRPQWDPLAFYPCSTESPLRLQLRCSPSASGGANIDHKFQRWKTVSINYPDDWCLAAFPYVALFLNGVTGCPLGMFDFRWWSICWYGGQCQRHRPVITRWFLLLNFDGLASVWFPGDNIRQCLELWWLRHMLIPVKMIKKKKVVLYLFKKLFIIKGKKC